jgi:hypothetical protein
MRKIISKFLNYLFKLAAKGCKIASKGAALIVYEESCGFS